MSLKLVCVGCKDKPSCVHPSIHEWSNSLAGFQGLINKIKHRVFTLEGEQLVLQLQECHDRFEEVLVWIRAK